jgi:hypothetical protein
MVSSAIVLLPLALAISSQAFRVPGQNLQSRALDALLVGRQIVSADGSVDVPIECKPTCGPAVTKFSDETCLADPKCICTDANMKSYSDCLNCLLNGIPDSDPEKSPVVEQGKSSVGNIVQACKANGITVASPAIGGGSSGASPSGGAAGAGSGAGASGTPANTASGSTPTGSTGTTGTTGGSTGSGSDTKTGTGSGTDTTGTNTTGTNDKQDDKEGAALSVRVSGSLLSLAGLVGTLVISL